MQQEGGVYSRCSLKSQLSGASKLPATAEEDWMTQSSAALRMLEAASLLGDMFKECV